MDRRDFMKGALAAGAVCTLPTALTGPDLIINSFRVPEGAEIASVTITLPSAWSGTSFVVQNLSEMTVNVVGPTTEKIVMRHGDKATF